MPWRRGSPPWVSQRFLTTRAFPTRSEAAITLLRQMERYAASVGCRHRHLSEYFGDTFPKDRCGACDYCLDELEPAAAPVVLARKILSCVARVGQRFGATHVASVLRGH